MEQGNEIDVFEELSKRFDAVAVSTVSTAVNTESADTSAAANNKRKFMEDQLRKLEKYLGYDAQYVPPAFGLVNNGNNCWANSVMQALLSISQINKFLIANQATIAPPLAQTYIKILSDALRGKNVSNASSAMMITLIQQMTADKRMEKLSTIHQECADEGLNFVIEYFKCQSVEYLCSHRITSKTFCGVCKKASYENMDETPNLVARFDYTPDRPVTNEREFVSAIIEKKDVISGYKCDNCGDVAADKVIVYRTRMMREVFIIRINNTMDKINTNLIWYPETFEIETLTTKIKYRLVATINHMGMQIKNQARDPLGKIINSYSSGGHYTTTAFRGGKYYTFNDSNVSETAFRINPQAYLLIYAII